MQETLPEASLGAWIRTDDIVNQEFPCCKRADKTAAIFSAGENNARFPDCILTKGKKITQVTKWHIETTQITVESSQRRFTEYCKVKVWQSLAPENIL